MTSTPTDYDLVILGSGGAAFGAAIRARDLGASVLMVERSTIGGTCVNIGCIPSKSLLSAAAQTRLTGRPSLAEAVASKAALVERLRGAKYEDLLGDYEIDFRAAEARLIDPHTVTVGDERVSAGAVLVATGARPAVPGLPGLDEAGYLTSTSALELSEAPARLAVLGAGPVGLELGQMFQGFGSEVTFIARRDVLPEAEPEAREALRSALEGRGARVLAPARVTEVTHDGDLKVLRGDGFELVVDEILVATGRVPNSEGIGLEDAGVALGAAGTVAVDRDQRTSVPSVFAAGDVTDQPRFVYVAAAAGAAAAANALGGELERLNFTALPQVVFTSPAFAQAGLTEAEARERGDDVETTVLPLEAVPRALVDGRTEGLFKLVTEQASGKLVGISIVADGAPDTIHAASLAIEHGLTATDLARGWAPYLSMAEGLKLAAQTFGRDVTRLSCCAA